MNEIREKFNFSLDFQEMVLACFIRYPEKFARYGVVLQPHYFATEHAVFTARTLLNHQKKYGNLPTWTALANGVIKASERVGSAITPEECTTYIQNLQDVDTRDADYVADSIIEFCKERAVLHAARELVNMLQEGKTPATGMVKPFEEALKVGQDLSNLGVDFRKDYAEVLRSMTKVDFGIKTGYELLDRIWPTGWPGGWLVVPLAPPKRYKCHAPDTPIMLHDGTSKMAKDIQVGDKLMGDDGSPRTVHTCGRGKGPMYRVDQSRGDSYGCNDAHILCLQNSKGEIKEMEAHDYAKQTAWFKRTWKGYSTGVEFPPQKVPLDPYFMGLWLGDGTAKKPEICVADADPEVRDYLSDFAHNLGLRVESYPGKSCNQIRLTKAPKRESTCSAEGCEKPHRSGGLCVRHYNRAYQSGDRVTKTGRWVNPVTKGLKDAGVFDSKHIPQSYKSNTREIRLQLLAGLIDSDGSFVKNRGLLFCNSNRQLADDVCWIARSLGFTAKVDTVKATCKERGFNGLSYRVYIKGKISEVPVKLPRKRAVDSVKATLRRTIKVTPVGHGEYYGFTIDGNNRYLLGDFTVTHNTAFCLNLARRMLNPYNGGDIIYYACEIDEALATARTSFSFTGLTQEDLFKHTDDFIEKVGDAVNSRMGHELIIKHFPAGSVSIQDLELHTQTLVKEHGIKPRAIFIDYADTVVSSLHHDRNTPIHKKQAAVYTEARAMGEKFNCVVVMPDRCNAETVGRRMPSMRSFQGAFEKAGIVDAAIGICATEEEYEADELRFFVFLNRHGEANQHLGGSIDPATMRIEIDQSDLPYDPEEAEAEEQGQGQRQGQRRQPRRNRDPEEALPEDLR